ncbi:MAG: hypothetical protein H7835_10365 [Magnetococcus sp. XQGC-1]
MSFKEQQELARLPGEIESLEAEQEMLHLAVADPAFYRRASDEVVATTTRLETLEQALALAYERWQTLEELASER